MRVRSWNKKLKSSLLALIAVVVVLAGCQAIGGFDVNKALVEAVIAKSMEGKGEFTVNLVLDDKAEMTPEQSAMLKLFETTTLTFDSIKMENSMRLSVKGSAAIAKYEIPFQASVTEEQVVLQIEGGRKPIVFNLQGEAGADALSGTMTPFLTDLQEKLSDGELSSSLMSYFIKQLPNPSKLNVESVTESINGEKVSLHKLHGEVTGQELLPLAKSFIKNVLKDDEALKALIGQVYDAIYPLIAAELDKTLTAIPDEQEDESYDEEDFNYGDSMELPGGGPLDQVKQSMEPLLTGVKAVLDDREIAIEVLHTEVKQLFIIALVALESTGDATQQQLDTVFNANNYVNTDLYFDNGFKLRKSNTTLMIAPEVQDSQGISAMRITMSMENWNVNGNVKADPISIAGGSLVYDPTSKPTDLLQNFDPQSDAYQLMKRDLGLGKISIPLFLGSGEYIPHQQHPFIENGVTMVPVRFISEQLNATVAWDSASQSIKVTDPATSRTIVLRGGSKTAVVDGKETEMEAEVLMRDDNSFVPLTFIVTQLGGKTEWIENLRLIQITKE